MTLVEMLRPVAATVTANTTAVSGLHTPVDATAGNVTITLPTGVNSGVPISIEKVDATSHTVAIVGTIRGVSSTLTLIGQYESLEFRSEPGGTSWRPTANHLPKAVVDAKIATQAASDSTTYPTKTNNLSDLQSASAARKNIGVARGVTPEEFGAAGDNTTVDDAAFAAALAYCSTNRLNLYLSAKYLLTQPITWNPDRHSILGNGYAVLNYTTATFSGFAVLVRATNTSTFDQTISRVSGVKFSGPTAGGTTVDLFDISGDASTTPNHAHMDHVHVEGFRNQVVFGDYSWCQSFEHCMFGTAVGRNVVHALTTPPQIAGEKYIFIDCTFHDPATTMIEVGLYAYYLDMHFTNCSFDFPVASPAVIQRSGVLNFYGCHFEGKQQNEFIQIDHQVTNTIDICQTTIVGGYWQSSHSVGYTAVSQFIRVTAASTQAKINLIGLHSMLRNGVSVLVQNDAGVPMAITRNGGQTSYINDTGNFTQIKLGALIQNGDNRFLSAPGTGNYAALPGTAAFKQVWYSPASPVMSMSTTDIPAFGTRSLSWAYDGVTTSSLLNQYIPCVPGQNIEISAVLKKTAAVGGLFIRCDFYGNIADSSSLITQVTALSLGTAAIAAWTGYVNQVTVPAGATGFRLLFGATNSGGTAFTPQIAQLDVGLL